MSTSLFWFSVGQYFSRTRNSKQNGIEAGPKVKQVQDFLIPVRIYVETEITAPNGVKAGTELEQIQEIGLQEEWISWGWFLVTPDIWIETIYKSYSKRGLTALLQN